MFRGVVAKHLRFLQRSNDVQLRFWRNMSSRRFCSGSNRYRLCGQNSCTKSNPKIQMRRYLSNKEGSYPKSYGKSAVKSFAVGIALVSVYYFYQRRERKKQLYEALEERRILLERGRKLDEVIAIKDEDIRKLLDDSQKLDRIDAFRLEIDSLQDKIADLRVEKVVCERRLEKIEVILASSNPRNDIRTKALKDKLSLEEKIANYDQALKQHEEARARYKAEILSIKETMDDEVFNSE